MMCSGESARCSTVRYASIISPTWNAVVNGRLIIEAEARGEAAGMMVAVFVLMIVGVVLSALIRRLQAYLLRW
jgi:hypothetical protein